MVRTEAAPASIPSRATTPAFGLVGAEGGIDAVEVFPIDNGCSDAAAACRIERVGIAELNLGSKTN